MTMDALTVVIPTYNRAQVLKKALDAYRMQSAPQLVREIIIVDDGSTDGTEAVVLEASRESSFPVRYLRQSNKGPAAARNYGIREARSPIVLFTDSDIVPERDLVSQHFEWHKDNPQTSVAILGYVTWPPDPKPTPFMRWYGEEGPLFAYRKFQHKREVAFSNFYTCNVSLKTDFLRTCGRFDEDFKGAAYEDIELAYRLSKAGLRLLYNPRAIAHHHQFFLFGDACSKALRNETATRVFLQKEAGRLLLEPRLRRRSRLWFRIAKWTAIAIASALKPARRLLNSYVPLPRFIYRLFFWHDGIRPVDVQVPEYLPPANSLTSEP
jgi:glycosyltransferase involved in cell wall biosynthesis